ncbi:glycerol-3-phosphate dehydrogenase [Paracoccus sp. S-4012]|uniref:NAD/NADP-dependent octopine/nopaline dehydrogenase family protein n=1 Tax=Paracoccus sp. S-4012 TaxID=2665648 RepID=UPI0012AEF52E|nr:NAD/NADP-dependent octopine/nopaline dehydrogenase family protein [Paracoccus sp. S-4012]MRX50030.1 glycerol-3-phosphate dehydrogenase [Paracoccus sp. S-4012]
MKIAVLGGGNGSLAAAADFALAGHEVALWRRGEAEVARHREGGNVLRVRDGKGSHEAKLAEVTSDLAAAMDGAALIFCPVPAPAHDDIAARVAPHLRPGQVVHLPPGTLGTLIFARAAQAAGTAQGVAFAESGTLPWLVRKHGFAEMVVSARATRLPTGIFPLALKDQAVAVLDRAFPGVIEPCGDALSGALMNAGPIIHPPLIIMNAAPLEHFPEWDIHNEGTQPSVRRTTDALDAERITVREALRYGGPHFPLADHYADDGEEWMYGRGSHGDLTDSGDWREKIVLTEHRYMLEDVKLGLSLLVSAARLAGVSVPVAEGLMAIGGAICGEDFMETGRPLSAVDLDGMDRAALQRFLTEGFPA